MPFVSASNTVMIELFYTLDGQRCENTLYFNKGSAWTTSTITTLINDVRTWWNTYMKPLQNSSCQLVLIKGTDLTTDSSSVVESTTSLPITGTLTGNKFPNNATIAVRFNTLSRGRSYRGRNYVVGITDNAATLNTVIASYAASLKTAYEKLLDVLVITTGVWSVVSRYHNNAPRPTAVITPIIGVQINTTVDSQRRRLPERGR